MPRPSKGARLFKRKPRYLGRKLVAQAVWIIKDGGKHIATGCVARPTETKPPQAAEQAQRQRTTKVDAVPNMPISNPYARATCVRLPASDTST